MCDISNFLIVIGLPQLASVACSQGSERCGAMSEELSHARGWKTVEENALRRRDSHVKALIIGEFSHYLRTVTHYIRFLHK